MKKILALLAAFVFFAAARFASAQSLPYSNTAGVTATLVAAVPSSAVLTGYNISNPNSATIYVQFFNASTTSGITLGTTAPFFSLAVPPFGVTDGPTTAPVSFSAGIVIAATTTPAGASAPTTAIPLTLFRN